MGKIAGALDDDPGSRDVRALPDHLARGGGFRRHFLDPRRRIITEPRGILPSCRRRRRRRRDYRCSRRRRRRIARRSADVARGGDDNGHGERASERIRHSEKSTQLRFIRVVIPRAWLRVYNAWLLSANHGTWFELLVV